MRFHGSVVTFEVSRRRGPARNQEDTVLTQVHDAVRDKAAQDAANGRPQSLSSEQLLERILLSLDEDKAEDVVQITLAGKSEMADFMVVCSGRSSRQVASISEKLVDRLKRDHGILCKLEGKDAGDWVLIDAGDVIVHVFRPEVREFYQLEKMWLAPSASEAAEA